MFQIFKSQDVVRRAAALTLAVFLLAVVPAFACGPAQAPVEEDSVQISQQHPAQADLFEPVRTERTGRIDPAG